MKSFLHKAVHWVSEWLAHYTGSMIGAAIVTGSGFTLLLGINTAIKALKNHEPIAKYFENPKELFSPIVISMLMLLLIVSVLSRARTNSTMHKFGIRLFSIHFDPETQKKDWNVIRGDIDTASAESSQLCILGATGATTFSNTDSPIHKTLQNYSGTICILLVCPNSAGFTQRVQGLSEDENSYRKEILGSLDYCRELLLHHKRKIEVRLYRDIPIWKMVMSNRALWIWHYDKQAHVGQTPLYGFEFASDVSGILKGYKTVFERRWGHESTVRLDLAKWDRSKWEKLLVSANPEKPLVSVPASSNQRKKK
jgi:hypothetical protein